MPSSPSDPTPLKRGGASAPQPDLDTDPGRPHPYESLYRSQPGETPQPSRPTPRHFEQHVSRPDGAQEGFGWLYRTEPGGPGQSPPPPGVAPAPEPARSRPRSRRPLVIVLVLLLIGALVAVGVVLLRERQATDPVATTTAAPQSDGPLAPVIPSRPTVSCQAPAATDDAGRPVAYGPGNLIDGDPETAWRCDGTGLGQTVTFTFPAPVAISQVSLINGYAKTDPTSGADRYPEYRRITQVTWTVGGVELDQTLADDDRVAQPMALPAQPVTQVTLRIDATAGPGSTTPTRDAVLISEVAFAG